MLFDAEMPLVAAAGFSIPRCALAFASRCSISSTLPESSSVDFSIHVRLDR